MSTVVFGELVDEYLEEMEQWMGALAVVTGASSGIGAATAKKLVRAGLKVVGVARRIEILEDIANNLEGEKGTFHPKQCDATNEEEVLETFQWIEETLGPISILINNAGILRATTLKDGATEFWKESFDLNVLAACLWTKEALKSMRNHAIEGHVIHVSGVVAYFVPDIPSPEPMLNVYPATKHAVRGMAETFRKELIRIDSKIKISSISPGITATENFKDFPSDCLDLEKLPKLKAEDVANAIIYILSTPPGVQITELVIRPVGEKI